LLTDPQVNASFFILLCALTWRSTEFDAPFWYGFVPRRGSCLFRFAYIPAANVFFRSYMDFDTRESIQPTHFHIRSLHQITELALETQLIKPGLLVQ
ncbi:MAG: hypothetical protein K8F91_23575, partial [Candidatus Obscuribacterales bacterium]|nr:hypothetical protein [Candidatus Obscuribacterales bacterium]